ncbi:hypothetical protein Scep_007028 [Stephania cephalantha]|uniref:Uncharacterized protein n=1 Tax=Stephania cephalantha TaxID=152367 RepID=A0AAP0PPL7_9MAGN
MTLATRASRDCWAFKYGVRIPVAIEALTCRLQIGGNMQMMCWSLEGTTPMLDESAGELDVDDMVMVR